MPVTIILLVVVDWESEAGREVVGPAVDGLGELLACCARSGAAESRRLLRANATTAPVVRGENCACLRMNGCVGEVDRELKMCFIKLRLVKGCLVEDSRPDESAAPLRIGVSAKGRFAVLIE